MVSGNPNLSARFLVDISAAIDECRGALVRTKGDVGKAAELLGVSRRTLFNWLKKHPEIRIRT